MPKQYSRRLTIHLFATRTAITYENSQRQMANNSKQMLKRYLHQSTILIRIVSSRRISSADPSTIQNKFMVGYQGWYVFLVQHKISPEGETSLILIAFFFFKKKKRFTCPGDGEPVSPGEFTNLFQLSYLYLLFTLQGHHGWLHWFNFPIPDGGRPNTDAWPDVSSYSSSELFLAPGLKLMSGEQTFLFSSRNATTVQRYLSL